VQSSAFNFAFTCHIHSQAQHPSPPNQAYGQFFFGINAHWNLNINIVASHTRNSAAVCYAASGLKICIKQTT
jgi:hypothetical protein